MEIDGSGMDGRERNVQTTKGLIMNVEGKVYNGPHTMDQD